MPRRIKNRFDARRARLMDAGCRLLALHDYDALAVNEFARDANCSVGAFYARFASKEEFIRSVVSEGFVHAKDFAIRDLDPTFWRRQVRAAAIRQIAGHIVSQASGERGGLVRAAAKLGQSNPLALAAYYEHRAKVTQSAIAILKTGEKHGDLRIGQALQMAHATAFDAAIHRTGPIAKDSSIMTQVLAEMISHFVGATVKNQKQPIDRTVSDTPAASIIIPRKPRNRSIRL